MKKIISILLMALMLFSTVALLPSCKSKVPDKSNLSNFVKISVQNFGDIFVELYPDKAPDTVNNFKALVESGHYDGTTFHRVIEGFMIQGGQGLEAVDSIEGEFAANGFDNPIKHKRGVISMARGEDMDSASDQFFICHKDSPHLDGQYAAFGKVVRNIDVVDKIAATEKYEGTSVPVGNVVIFSISFVTEEEATKTPTPDEKPCPDVNPSPDEKPTPDNPVEESNKVKISVKDFGDIVVELNPEEAPITVANFKKLVKENHYKGTVFHRIIKGFMIQGGQGVNVPSIKGEFSANGVTNNIKHERGVISMARTPDMNSASDQFFICHKDSFFLDGQYAAFGKVISGMEVVDKIASVRTGANDAPRSKVEILSVSFV